MDRHLSDRAIEEYLERSLADGQEGEAARHLALCAHCAARAHSLQSLFREMANLAQPVPSPGFADRVMARVERARPECWAVSSWQIRSAAAQAAALSLLPFLAACIVSFWGWQNRGRAERWLTQALEWGPLFAADLFGAVVDLAASSVLGSAWAAARGEGAAAVAMAGAVYLALMALSGLILLTCLREPAGA